MTTGSPCRRRRPTSSKPEQLAWIKDWITGGAPWPDEAKRNAIAKASADKWSAEDGITVKVDGRAFS
jgi:hypothetical protein